MKHSSAFPPRPSGEQLKIVALAYKRRNRYWLDYFWHVRLESNNLFNNISHTGLKSIQEREGNYTNPQSMRTYLLDSADKINACFYHLERLKAEERSIIKLATRLDRAKDMPPNVMGISGFPTEVIDHEVEAFFWAFESSLEIFARGISYYFNGEATFKKLSTFLRNTKVESKKAQKIIGILEENRFQPIFKEVEPGHPQKSKRDLISHFRSLKMVQTNLQFTSRGYAILKAQFREYGSPDPLIEKPISIERYCTDLLYLLCDLQIEILGAIFETKYTHGKKMSVWQARKLKRI